MRAKPYLYTKNTNAYNPYKSDYKKNHQKVDEGVQSFLLGLFLTQ